MNERDTYLIMGMAALAAALYFQFHHVNAQRRLEACETQFQSFKEGVIYGR